jgi:hypothetical protein
MALWFDVNINSQRIGTIDIQRREPLDLTDPASIQDAVCTYVVRRDGDLVGTVRHRYGDGVWVLLVIATDLIANGLIEADGGGDDG